MALWSSIPGSGQLTDKVLAAIRSLSNKEIRWVINTEFDRDHAGGNEAISKAGRTVNGNPAAVVAHENAAARMAQAGVPDNARPFNTYFEDARDFPFNGEPVLLYHDPARIRTAARWSCSGARTSSSPAMRS